MKTTKILATFVATAVIATLTLNTYAMGNGQLQGKGNWQGQMQNNLTGKSNKAKTHSPGDMIKDVSIGTLSEEEKQSLYYQYSEEMLAYDIYNYFFSKYGVQTFANIAESEAEHMAAVKVLLDRYGLETPTGYGELQSTFDSLKAEGEKSLQSALEVGIKIEMLDIDDISDTIKKTDNDDIKIIFTNIGGASYNHLRGFIKGLANNGLTTSIDYSSYLSADQVNTTGTLKHLLAEKLEKEGVSLPTQANSVNVKSNCANEEKAKGQRQGQRKGKWHGKNLSSEQKAKNQKMKDKYKVDIGKKYGKYLEKLSDENLKSINAKIDTAIEKVEAKTSISDTVKQKTLSLYMALKEYIAGLLK